MYKAYVFTDFDSVSDELLEKMIHLLPSDRKEKALRCRKTEQRKASVIAYFLLIYGFRELGIADIPVFFYGQYGTPYLKNNPEVFFNISHCNEGCMCVISDKEIGCDIQEIRLYSHDVALRACCAEELTAIEAADDEADIFTEIWTKKESYIKKTGKGVNNNFILINTNKLECTMITYRVGKCYISICH